MRHFLESGALLRVISAYDTTLVFPPADWARLCNSPDVSRWGVPARRIAIPNVRRDLFNQLFFIDQARPRLDREWREIRSGWLSMIGRKAALKYSLMSLPLVSAFAMKVIRGKLAAVPAIELHSLINEIRPDILIHPSIFKGYFINDLSEIAKQRAIPFILLMNSWDNPSLKRAALGSPDAVAVWGEQTARHSHKFMRIPRERIHVLGAAQFQLYRDPPDHDRGEVCVSNGIDPAKPIILYAGSSKGNREHFHLQRLNDAIADGTLPAASILYRPHPFGVSVDEARRIIEVELPHVVVEHSMRNLLLAIAEERHKGFFITPYADTHDLLSAVDIVISPLSTILIEAALHGKPALCFVPEEEDKNSIWKSLRQLVHFQELMHSPGLMLAQSHAEFLPAVQRLFTWVADPAQARRIRAEMEYFVQFPQIRYDQAVLDLANSLLARWT